MDYKKAVSFVEKDVLSASYIDISNYDKKYVEKTNENEYSVQVEVTVQNKYCVENTYVYECNNLFYSLCVRELLLRIALHYYVKMNLDKDE